MRKTNQQLARLLAGAVEAAGFEYVGYEFNSGNLRIYIDSPTGISADDCGKVSRQVGAVLDVEDPIPGAYTLEISSPGINRPLFSLEHYERFVGEKIALKTHAPVEGQRNFKGILTGVESQKIHLQSDEKIFEFDFDDIEKGHLVG